MVIQDTMRLFLLVVSRTFDLSICSYLLYFRFYVHQNVPFAILNILIKPLCKPLCKGLKVVKIKKNVIVVILMFRLRLSHHCQCQTHGACKCLAFTSYLSFDWHQVWFCCSILTVQSGAIAINYSNLTTAI